MLLTLAITSCRDVPGSLSWAGHRATILWGTIGSVTLYRPRCDGIRPDFLVGPRPHGVIPHYRLARSLSPLARAGFGFLRGRMRQQRSYWTHDVAAYSLGLRLPSVGRREWIRAGCRIALPGRLAGFRASQPLYTTPAGSSPTPRVRATGEESYERKY